MLAPYPNNYLILSGIRSFVITNSLGGTKSIYPLIHPDEGQRTTA